MNYSVNNDASCEVCHSRSATHICNDCGLVFCESCIKKTMTQFVFCADCGSEIIGKKETKDGPVYYCLECGSQNLKAGRRINATCPKCGSKNISSISSIKSELSNRIKDEIGQLRYGAKVLVDLSKRINSAKRSLVSLRMSNFVENRGLEDSLNKLFSAWAALKVQIESQTKSVAKEIISLTKGWLDTNRWAPSDFHTLEGIISRIEIVMEQYLDSINKNSEQIQKDIKILVEQINELEMHREKYESFWRHCRLNLNEFPVAALDSLTLTDSTFLKVDKCDGILYLTNQRVIFIAVKGLFSKKEEIEFEIDLGDVAGTQISGRLRKRIDLITRQGSIQFVYYEELENILESYLNRAKEFNRNAQLNLEYIRQLDKRSINATNIMDAVEKILKIIFKAGYQIRSQGNFERFEQEQIFTKRNIPIISERPIPNVSSRPLTPDIIVESRINERINQLEQNKFSIEKMTQQLKEMHKMGEISIEQFTKQYLALMKELYIVNDELEKIKNFSRVS